MTPLFHNAFVNRQATFALRRNQLDHIRQPITHHAFGDLQVITCLQIEPVLRRLPQRTPKAQRQFRCHRARPVHPVRHAHGGNPDDARKTRLRNA